MDKPLSFAALRTFLQNLGCTVEIVPKSRVVFAHEPTGALIILRFYRDEEVVSPTDLTIVRRVLDEFGALSADGFRPALEQAVSQA